MRLLSNRETKDVVALLKCIMGSQSPLYSDERTDEKIVFEIQCLFFMHLCSKKSFIQSAQFLLKSAIEFNKNEMSNDSGGSLSNLTVVFAAGTYYLIIFHKLG